MTTKLRIVLVSLLNDLQVQLSYDVPGNPSTILEYIKNYANSLPQSSSEFQEKTLTLQHMMEHDYDNHIIREHIDEMRALLFSDPALKKIYVNPAV